MGCNLALGDMSNTIMGYLWPCSLQGHFRLLQCTYLQMACNSKAAGHRSKRTGIWDSGRLATHMWYLWPFSGQGLFWSFGAIVSKCPVTPKRLVVGETDWSLGLINICKTCMGLPLPQYCTRSFCGHSVYLSQSGLKLKKVAHRAKQTEL